MKYFVHKPVVAALGLFMTSTLWADTAFDIRAVSGSTIDVTVNATGPTEYGQSQGVSTQKPVQVRGQCRKKWAIDHVTLNSSGGSKLLKDRSSGHRSLTANSGATWATKQVGISIRSGNGAFAQKCNQEAQRLLNQNKTYLGVYGAGFTVYADEDEQVDMQAQCYDNSAGFIQPPQITDREVHLPIRLRCSAGGYQPPDVNVTSLQWQLTPITNQVTGACKVKVAGSLSTNYADFAAEMTQAPRNVKYRYRFESIPTGHQSNSAWVNKKLTLPNNAGFSFDHTADVPESLATHPGRVWIEVDTGDEVYRSDKKQFELDCAETYDISLNTHIPAKATLKISAINATRTMRNGQLCPTQVRMVGRVTSGTAPI